MAGCTELITEFVFNSDNKDILGSCLQAAATIKAAKIQARATTIAGWFTLAAALTAVLGAAAAYLSALRQVKLDEDRYKVRVHAYKLHLFDILYDLSNELDQIYLSLVLLKVAHKGQSEITGSINISLDPSPTELGSEAWELHSMLAESELRAVARIRNSLTVFNSQAKHCKSAIQANDAISDDARFDRYLEELDSTKEHIKKIIRKLMELLGRETPLPKEHKDTTSSSFLLTKKVQRRRWSRLRVVLRFLKNRTLPR